MGGMLRAIETGYVQREIQEAAYQFQRDVESGEAVVVGVNRFQSTEGPRIPIYRVDPAIEIAQVQRVKALRSRRDSVAVESALAGLDWAARGTANVVPRILDCIEAFVTVGEISNRLRTIWGEYREALTV
jgi:methylmalonyl-CoA mutase N-terminal domain/subunit